MNVEKWLETQKWVRRNALTGADDDDAAAEIIIGLNIYCYKDE